METKDDFLKPFVLGMYFVIVWYFFCYYVLIPWLFPSKKSTSPGCNSGKEITDEMIDASGKVCIVLGNCSANPGYYVTSERVLTWKNHMMKNADKLFRIERVVSKKSKAQPKKSKGKR